MKTEFDLCLQAQPLRDQLWFSRGDPDFWTILQRCDERVRLQPSATAAQLGELQHFAGGSLPSSLTEFLAHSNGLLFDYDAIVFPAEQIIRQTEQMRQFDSFMPLDHLLFIGALGDGDMFAFGKTRSGEWSHDVYWWEHETDSRYACGLGIWGYIAAHVSWCHFIDR